MSICANCNGLGYRAEMTALFVETDSDGAWVTACYRCASNRVEWAGRSKRAVRRGSSLDVHQCQACGHAWYYARSGRRITVKTFATI